MLTVEMHLLLRNVWIVDCSSSSNSPTTEILLSQSVDTLEFKATLQWPGTEFHPIVMMCSYISFYKRSWIRQEMSSKVSKTHFRHCFFLKAGMKLLKTIDALNYFFPIALAFDILGAWQLFFIPFFLLLIKSSNVMGDVVKGRLYSRQFKNSFGNNTSFSLFA